MAANNGEAEQEKLPLQQDEECNLDTTAQNTAHDPNQTGQSLIRHVDETADSDLVSPYSRDPTALNDAYENPYKETTDTSQSFIRRVPSSDLVPAPFKKFNHVLILSVVGAVFFIFTGLFAVRLARNAKMQHSKGLYGLAQRDSKKSTILSYLSIFLGVLMIIIIVIVAESV